MTSSDSRTPIERKRDAAQATLDRFKDRPFRYGREDCVRMAAFHLRKLGYRVKLPTTDGYRSAKGAVRELRARGHADLIAAVDAQGLERIAPAEAVVGDILGIPGEGPFGAALLVVLGGDRCVGYHQDVVGAAVLQPVEFVTAWRATPQER